MKIKNINGTVGYFYTTSYKVQINIGGMIFGTTAVLEFYETIEGAEKNVATYEDKYTIRHNTSSSRLSNGGGFHA